MTWVVEATVKGAVPVATVEVKVVPETFPAEVKELAVKLPRLSTLAITLFKESLI